MESLIEWRCILQRIAAPPALYQLQIIWSDIDDPSFFLNLITYTLD